MSAKRSKDATNRIASMEHVQPGYLRPHPRIQRIHHHAIADIDCRMPTVRNDVTRLGFRQTGDRGSDRRLGSRIMRQIHTEPRIHVLDETTAIPTGRTVPSRHIRVALESGCEPGRIGSGAGGGAKLNLRNGFALFGTVRGLILRGLLFQSFTGCFGILLGLGFGLRHVQRFDISPCAGVLGGRAFGRQISMGCGG